MKAVVVHRGARDAYQVALALAEHGRLERLVTDLYWKGGSGLAGSIERLAGGKIGHWFVARRRPELSPKLVKLCAFSGWLSFLFEKNRRFPFRWKTSMARWADRRAGSTAGRIASRSGAALVSYSYYAHSAFSGAAKDTPRILFQLHPHPASMRRILLRELSDQPDCANSLRKEWELALSEEDYTRLVQEAGMAETLIVASDFSRQTLIENGIDKRRIHVVPYGVDLGKFYPAPNRNRPAPGSPLKLLFVGQINQRKGIKYLLEALKLLPNSRVELTVCGRVIDDLHLFRDVGDRVKVRGSVNFAELLKAFQSADLFVFPSLAEGFGHVLLEAMACGLPVLSTTRTAAPDLVTECEDGFVIEPRRADLIASRIEWCLEHRDELFDMGLRARRKAEQFTWERFRERVANAIEQSLPREADMGVELAAARV
jgi:glycosyltransferase involved in cell wall biosynthesis